ncbi:hypothetical protein COCNU_04G008450 [Cocos nucifera]|uniref:Uncharacterized protein n=1 Tax=Cocos nucifera TaxID=13894 RepID=A0A8K0N0S5_COCNU|nr:hypothetical protein COCNU_04G008450 [Cocos nucifera]
MEKGLREKDLVVFYRFQGEQDGHKNQYYMIDMIPFETVILRKDADEVIENQRTEDGLDAIQKSMEKKMEEEIPKKILTRGHEGVEEAVEKSSTGEQEVMKVEDEDRHKMSLCGSEETNLEENSSGSGGERHEAREIQRGSLVVRGSDFSMMINMVDGGTLVHQNS